MPNRKQTPVGLWKACDEMENVSVAKLHIDLSPFRKPIENCYEAGVQVPTIPAKRHNEDDIRFAALFLKRTLNDLRAVWLLSLMGYTSQAASVAASLFEHSLTVNALAGNSKNAQRLKQTKDGDIPWSPIQLSKLMATQNQDEAAIIGKSFSEKDFDLIWREVYASYKFLCKIKHPTSRSTIHDASSASINSNEYVVIAAPDLRQEDLPLKATVLLISISRTYQAIRRFSLSLECQTDDPYYEDFINRMKNIAQDAEEAFKQITKNHLPFDISDDNIAIEYRSLKK